jgi:hypothetical protein
MEDNTVKIVKDIILSRKFQSYEKPQQMGVLEKIIQTGDVPKETVMNIYANSITVYLESLPYNVFLNIILNNDIKGRELFNLCNSSPLINEQCNKSFTLENSDTVVPQYLFVLLLNKAGIDYEKIKQKRPKILPRNMYYYYFVGDGVSFRRLQDKFLYIVNALDQEGFMPKDLCDLLYTRYEIKPKFFEHLVYAHRTIYLKRFDYINEIAGESEDILEPLNIEVPNNIEELLKIIAKITKDSYEEILLRFYNYIKDDPKRVDNFHKLFPDYELTVDNIAILIKNSAEYFRQHLLAINSYSNDHYKLFKIATEIADNINMHIEEDPKADLSKLLDKDDIEYIIRLHMRVLSGDLNIYTPFTLSDLL